MPTMKRMTITAVVLIVLTVCVLKRLIIQIILFVHEEFYIDLKNKKEVTLFVLNL